MESKYTKYKLKYLEYKNKTVRIKPSYEFLEGTKIKTQFMKIYDSIDTKISFNAKEIKLLKEKEDTLLRLANERIPDLEVQPSGRFETEQYVLLKTKLDLVKKEILTLNESKAAIPRKQIKKSAKEIIDSYFNEKKNINDKSFQFNKNCRKNGRTILDEHFDYETCKKKFGSDRCKPKKQYNVSVEKIIANSADIIKTYDSNVLLASCNTDTELNKLHSDFLNQVYALNEKSILDLKKF